MTMAAPSKALKDNRSHFLYVPGKSSVIANAVMGFNLAVFTAALFLLALVQCCYATGGTSPSDDPASAYLTVLISK